MEYEKQQGRDRLCEWPVQVPHHPYGEEFPP